MSGIPYKLKLKRIGKEINARVKAEWKATLKKPLEVSLREHLGKLIDRIDPIELVALVATTTVVHGVICGASELLKKTAAIYRSNVGGIPFGLGTLMEVSEIAAKTGKIVIFGIKNPLTGEIIWEWSIPTGSKFDEKATGTLIAIVDGIQIPDWYIWIVSFAIAYFLVKNPGAIIGLAGQGLTGMTKIAGALLA